MLPGLACVAGLGQPGEGFAVGADPTVVSRTSSTSTMTPKLLRSPYTDASAYGGSGSYTYAWTYLSGDASITPTNPASAFTAFDATLEANEAIDATFRCTVTDTVTGRTGAVEVSASFHLVYTG